MLAGHEWQLNLQLASVRAAIPRCKLAMSAMASSFEIIDLTMSSAESSEAESESDSDESVVVIRYVCIIIAIGLLYLYLLFFCRADGPKVKSEPPEVKSEAPTSSDFDDR